MDALFVLACLYKENEVLLLRRSNQQFGRGLYSLVGGKVEQGERALAAIQREVLEEVGLLIPEELFEGVHILHRKAPEIDFVAICFKVDISAFPAPSNKEPHKHDDMRFFPFTQLPENSIPAHKQAMKHMLQNKMYSEYGW